MVLQPFLRQSLPPSAGAAGFLTFHQGYMSSGLIEIQPVFKSQELLDRVMPLYQQYIATVVTTLHSERVMKAAMQSPEWKAHRPPPQDQYLADWNKNLIVKLVPNSFYIQVTYTDEHKDAKIVAPIAVTSLIKAYSDLYGNEQKTETDRKIDIWNKNAKVLNQQIAWKRSLIESKLQNVGEDIQAVVVGKLRENLALEEKLLALQEEVMREQDYLKQAKDQAGSAYSDEDLARVDPAMEALYRVKVQLEGEVQELETRLGPNNPAARAAHDRLAIRVQQMKKYRDERLVNLFHHAQSGRHRQHADAPRPGQSASFAATTSRTGSGAETRA